MAETAAILLAAGESRRMGQLKALLPWQGGSLLEYQVSVLKAGGVDRVVVVLGHRAQELSPLVENIEGVDWVLNPDYLQGKTTSIKVGVQALGSTPPGTLLILNVDQPRSEKTIRSLLNAHEANDALITIPTYKARGGHPVILDGSLLGEMLEIEEESQGMKELVQRHSDRTERVEVNAPEVLWDLNTPEQYQAAIES